MNNIIILQKRTTDTNRKIIKIQRHNIKQNRKHKS